MSRDTSSLRKNLMELNPVYELPLTNNNFSTKKNVANVSKKY